MAGTLRLFLLFFHILKFWWNFNFLVLLYQVRVIFIFSLRLDLYLFMNILALTPALYHINTYYVY